ncbi:MAG: hydrogen peroxide-inducible genes activator [Bacteroidales bacterium]|nr:hydrogen peroxide-inducible genes activator [Bacteroidales bacterium]
MNKQQLEYIIALDNFRHFVKASEACLVTQPTLSMMIQKLEEELNVRIFDRSKHPIEPTPVGIQIIAQARTALKHFNQIKEIVENEQQVASGSFTLGIIPTIATFLVPSILQKQQKKYQNIELVLKEYTTANMIPAIVNGTLDGGILAGPLNHAELKEYPLYYEKLYAYVSPKDALYKKKAIDLDTIDIRNIWLLDNVHCLSGQIERLCQKQKNEPSFGNITYKSGNIETLIHIIDYNFGITIIPEMHAMSLTEEQQENLRPFKNRTAVREVVLACSHAYIRKTMLNAIMDMVKSSVPKSMKNPMLQEFVIGL